jgi:hypothetical protein
MAVARDTYAFWIIDNDCDEPVSVSVACFRTNMGAACDCRGPVAKEPFEFTAGNGVTFPPDTPQTIAGRAKAKVTNEETYYYEVCINGRKGVDPVIVIKP